jgi:hypothetical protein
MSRGGRDDLMEALERVLRAQTADLRELAKVAGADPRGFYIGTKLDGVDLRGQDLRGMILPGLDQAKVRTDEGTLLDEPAPDPPLSDQGIKALVYVASWKLWGMVERGGHGTRKALFCGPDEASSFAEHCRAFRGAKLILVDDAPGGWPWDRTELPKDEVLVPILRTDRPQAYAGPARLPSGIRDAIIHFSADWETLSKFAHLARYSVFLRAQGSSTSPFAWLQLYSWAVQARVERAGGYRLGLPEDRARPPGLDFEEFFFSHLTRQSIELPPDAKYIAATLVSSNVGGRESAGLSYAKTVRRLLSAQGWRADRLAERRDGEPSSLRVEGGDCRIDLAIDERAEPLRPQVFAPLDIGEIDLENLDRIVVTEACDTASVVARLATSSELRVSVRDLAHLKADGASEWSLIGQQAMRLSRSGPLIQRIQYLAILLRRAVLRAMPRETLNVMAELLDQHDFFESKKLQVGSVQWNGETVDIDIVLDVSSERLGKDVLRFRLSIGSDGPTLEDVD